MCGGIYEEDFNEQPEMSSYENVKSTKAGQKTETSAAEQVRVESGNGGVMGDIKFTTAGEYMKSLEDNDVTVGS
jgi:hypothetical protein